MSIENIYFCVPLLLRYGYAPLPKTISQRSFEDRVASQPPTEATKLLLEKWYSLDGNADPSRYVLRDLTSNDRASYWTEVLPKLAQFLDGVPFDDDFPDLLVNRSVTELEVKCAMACESDTTSSRTFWLHREFKGDVPAESCCDFYDGHNNPGKDKYLRDLKKWMHSAIPLERTIKFSDASFDSFRAQDTVWQAQFDYWEREAEKVLRESLRDIIEQKRAWDADGAGNF